MPERHGVASGKRVTSAFAKQLQLTVQLERVAREIAVLGLMEVDEYDAHVGPDATFAALPSATRERMRTLAKRVQTWIDPAAHTEIVKSLVAEMDDEAEVTWAQGGTLPSAHDLIRETCSRYAAKQVSR